MKSPRTVMKIKNPIQEQRKSQNEGDHKGEEQRLDNKPSLRP